MQALKRIDLHDHSSYNMKCTNYLAMYVGAYLVSVLQVFSASNACQVLVEREAASSEAVTVAEERLRQATWRLCEVHFRFTLFVLADVRTRWATSWDLPRPERKEHRNRA